MDAIEPVIGIDLGTTNSVVAVIESSEPKVIPNQEGHVRTPSVVAIGENNDYTVGEIALRQAATQPHRIISSIKRLIGRLRHEINEEEEIYPYVLSEHEDGRVMVSVGERDYLPEQIAALVLQKIKEAAENYLGGPVGRAVITVPAYFDDNQRQATMEAARLAGLEVLRLLNEPTAAAMAYGLGRDGHETVAVYDFGGGTFDFSILDIENNTFEVLVSTGNSRLGGDDLDTVLLDYVADRFQSSHGLDLRADPVTLRRLKDACERAKCELSTAEETIVSLPFITYRDGNALHLEERINRETLEDLIEPLIQETLECCMHGMRQAKIRKGELSKVILVGGSTRIPLVQDSVEDFFGIQPFKGINPDEIVSIGAAMQGAVMNGELDEVVLLDVTPHTLGIEIKGNRKSNIVEKNSTIPIKVFKTFSTTEDHQQFVNIHVLQGDSDKACDCRSLGRFTLSGIQDAPAGVPRIRVTFFINADGMVEISANDMQSGAERSLMINHAYLPADERRTSQTGERRRRRRRSAATASNSERASSRGRDDSRPPLPRAAQLSAETGSRRHAAALADHASENVAPDFAEVQEESPTSPTQPRHDDTRMRPAATSTAGLVAAMGAMAPVPPVSRAQAEAAETVAVSAPPDPRTGDRRPLRPAIPPNVPPPLEPLVSHLLEGRHDESARAVYESSGASFLAFCREHPGQVALQLLLARYFIMVSQAEDSLKVLEELRERRATPPVELLGVYNELCNRFPDFLPARGERAGLAEEAGNLNTAMEDLEAIVEHDPEDPVNAQKLIGLYRRVLNDKSDPVVQFKLIKIHLQLREVDAAIAQLQQLVAMPEHRNRANKILGLCFWQKGMRYLAWQKFRALPLTDEIKDILYRLADDMEIHDELLHAKYALERIYEMDISFRETAERLKKLTYRLELQKDLRYGSGPGGIGNAPTSPGGDTNSELKARFEIIEEINRGSMGIVFKARDKILDEVVAIKLLNDFLCTDPEAVERFKQEARSARKLTHANIVRIHDMFELDNKKIISMEFIEGDNLKTLLSRNVTFSEDMVLTYLVQICEGLAYAHRFHIVHRDIKPANIMINDHNQVKITDFGIAKLLTEPQTKAGTMVMGTPLYMAPEQIEGGKIDHRCDIYALGIMLYEMVMGSPPFHEGNIEYQHIHTPVPEIAVGVSDRLRKIIMHCVQKRPEDRFQTVEEIMTRII
ncbi:molecular chaperone DnaK [bacterium]|nr:molecular chaperone DnaK [bacterium]